ncbi:hypothetical protein IQ07DRAFT_146735 [Pyrenochaeta sp. DS3sAY3a]|nr:hypothetical protein IQ07DRAFT_146735 [Pyrenochaeta sp. DS3sAY3a]
MSSTIVHSTFITSTTSIKSTSTAITTAFASSTPITIISSIPQAPPAGSASRSNSTDGWSPAAIIGIVTAVVFLLIMVPLIAVTLRHYERKRLQETVQNNGSGGLDSSKSSITEGQSLKSILVTREMQRSSVKLGEGVDRPEQAHIHERGWSRTEVRAGGWK